MHRFAYAYYQNNQFKVDAYKKPEFKLSVSSKRDKYANGDTIKLKVKGEYYFGGPLAYSEVKVRWYKQQMHYYGGFGSRFKGMHFYPRGTRKLYKEEKHTLNENGELDICYVANFELDHGYIIAEVIAVDKSRREIREEKSFSVSKYDTFLSLQFDKWRYEKGENIKCQISAVSISDSKVEGPVKLKVKMHGEILVDSLIKLNENGIGDFNFKANIIGSVNFIVEYKTKNGKVIKKEHSVRVDSSTSHNYRWDFSKITFDKQIYYTGDTAIVSVQTGADGIRTLCTVEGSRIFNYGIKNLKNNFLTYKVPIKKGMGSQIHFKVTYSGENNMIIRSQSAQVRDRSLFLDVKVDAKKSLEPGETFRGVISVKNHKGIPVKAKFSIALVDEAVFAIAEKLKSDNSYSYYNRHNSYGNDLISEIFKIFPYSQRNRVNDNTSSFKAEYLEVLKGGYLQTLDDLMENYRFTKKGVLSIISGKSEGEKIASADLFGEGGFASGIDAVLSGVGGLKRGSQIVKNKTGGGGIGYGAGIGSGFGGGSGGVDDLIGSLMGGDGSSLNLKKRGSLKNPPRERSDFKDLAYWSASCSTNSSGRAKIKIKMPDDLTQWRLVLIGSDGKIHFIEHNDTLVTKQNVMIKLEAPRSVVNGDSLIITSVVHNYSDTALKADVSFKVKQGSAMLLSNSVKPILIEQGGTERIDWPVKITGTDSLEFYSSIISEKGSDAESRKYPVLYKGIVKRTSSAGVVGYNSNEVNLSLNLPENLKRSSHKITLRCSPTLVGSMFESLEYLTGYPYGCVEQTMSRFLPNLYVQKIMKQMNIKNDSLMEMMPKYTHAGIERLEQLQNSDGSWGWWRSDRGDGRLTALVLYGLQYALNSQIEDEDKTKLKNMLNKGQTAAIRMIKSNNMNLNNKASLIHSVYKSEKYRPMLKKESASLFQKRDSLSTASIAKLLEVTNLYNMQSEKSGFLKMILSRAVKSGDVVYWKGSSRYSWYRQNEETTAQVLKVLVSVIPDNNLIPLTVKWLSRRKKNGYWVSTKTTARVIEAISTYLLKSKELDPNYKAKVLLNGKIIHESGVINKKSITYSDFELIIDTDKLVDTNCLEILINGDGTLYYSLIQQYVEEGDKIRKNDNGISITRSYNELKYLKDEKGNWNIVREPFDGVLTSGEELEVTIKVENSSAGEFMMIEDFFPSGMEYLRKPEKWYNRWCGFWFRGYTHKEARDDRMVFFMTQASQNHTFSYLLRAETPGKYTILPAKGELMYEPEVCGNSESMEIVILDKE